MRSYLTPAVLAALLAVAAFAADFTYWP